MSNHYHLVVCVDQKRAKALSQNEVVERWTQLFRGPPVVERWCTGKATQAERQLAELNIEKWRNRLSDLSWFMTAPSHWRPLGGPSHIGHPPIAPTD